MGDLMDQTWFEMPENRRRKLANAVWIPLRAIHRIEETGLIGHVGFKTEFYGVGTLAVPVICRQETEKLGWMDIGISHNHFGCVEKDEYIPADAYKDYCGKWNGLHLVLDQHVNSVENHIWHLHLDFVVTMGLKREGNIWVRPSEGYIEVARLVAKENGSPYLLEVRASHLRDYLCARNMALYITSYRERVEVFANASAFTWKENHSGEINGNDQWEGRIAAIHEGGMPYGGKTAYFNVARTDVDPEEDVPVFGLPPEGNIKSNSSILEHEGKKLYRVSGRFWRTEWVEPAEQSPIVRGDKIPSTVFFITDAEGKKENSNTLASEGRWLWFRPEVMNALIHYRGGALNWYTRDTGGVCCSPDYDIHFGVNSIGLINVYAKDIALLPEWQQKIWAGNNISPEGKVSKELLSAQMEAEPASTKAPEEYLERGLTKLNQLCETNIGISVIRQHDQFSDLIVRCHRFRSVDKEGLFSLAKDLARLTADSIDAAALQNIAPPAKGEKLGSLKSLEKLIAIKIGPETAKTIMSPLFGIYELRLADAHLVSKDVDDALQLVMVDQKSPFVLQGYQLLDACVGTIFTLCEIIDNWKEKQDY